ncbi:MAG: SPFH domain-containing protein, partial [Planctomycetota bacterium]
MRTDHVTYQLATRVTLAGLILQLILSLTVLIFGIAGGDQVMRTVGEYMLLGLPIWATLLILFHQHKLERIEALEAQEIAERSAGTGSIFEIGDDEMNMAARRLRWMYRILVPAVSLVLAGAFIGLGLYRYDFLQLRLNPPNLEGDAAAAELQLLSSGVAGWGLAVTAAIAVIGFIFSRYLSGMSREPAWANMRAAAAAMVGTALLNGALAIGLGMLRFDNPGMMRALALIIPIFVLILGIEIAINFLLNIYRPRRAGEIPRPAFDSRILSLLAAPDSVIKSISDAINYQFGFEVTSSWAYRLFSRQILPLVLFCVGLLVLLNCVAIVAPYERAVVTRFGELVRVDERGEPRVFKSGLVWRLPWERVERYPVYRVHEFAVGTEPRDDARAILWDRSHTATAEDLIIVAPMRDAGELDFAVTDEENVVAANYSVLNALVPIQYQIREGVDADGRPELLNYINFIEGGEREREAYLEEIAARVITEHLATRSIDEVLSVQRSALAFEVQDRLQRELDELESGIEVVFVGVSGIHPPLGNDQARVAEAFEEVLQAREEKETAIEEARTEAIKTLASVAGNERLAQQIADRITEYEQRRSKLGSGLTEAEVALRDPELTQMRAQIEDFLVNAGGEAAVELLRAQAFRWTRSIDEQVNWVRQEAQLEPFRRSPRYYIHREYLKRLEEAITDSSLLRLVLLPKDADRNVVSIDLLEDP